MTLEIGNNGIPLAFVALEVDIGNLDEARTKASLATATER
jgi:hypothetical protein